MTKRIDQEFRDNAVRLALEKKIPVKQLAADLGIGKSTLTSWMTAYRKGNKVVSGENPEQKEIRRLKRENEILREERDDLPEKSRQFYASPLVFSSYSTGLIYPNVECKRFLL